MTEQPNPNQVICPACVHQFQAIPENVQAELRRLHSVNAQLLEALEDCREALRRAGAIGELLVVDNAIAAAKEKACKSAS